MVGLAGHGALRSCMSDEFKSRSKAARASAGSSSRNWWPSVCGDALDANGRALLDLLAENDRIDYLPEIATHFDELKAEHQNVADVEVVSAAALNDAQQQRLAGALRARLRRDVRLHCTVDPSLIGGAVVRSGDLLIDGSLANKLQRLGTELTTG